ncbi:transcriptional repressor LexA [Pelotalea chapellei]|uniref:LexA repressor n=1 Tax=Pelotalea chapellei TaxID=44671 RepID=A0ABS5U3R2_9BACT|nr:transcriptional repressor LexA [Pelotalea chapellei]MBT1070302.1 transcriptional repressor LexA [Pelotalea chapellei]
MTTIKVGLQHDLTPRQQQVLQFVTSHLDNQGYPPTLREIAAHLGVSGPLPVSKHLDALEKKGYIKRDKVSRGIGLTTSLSRSVSLPIAGTVRAGHLSPAIEDIQGYFSVDHLAVKGNDCFFLRVSGDSMIGAGIFDGDLALVRPQQTADNKDTVVAMVEGEATLKWFYHEQDHIRLQPANPNMSAIIIRPGDGEVSIVGKVIGVYRRLG